MQAQTDSSSVYFSRGIKKSELLEEFCLILKLDPDSSIFDRDSYFAVFNLFTNERTNNSY